MLNEQIIEEAKSYSTFIGSQGKSSFGELYDAFIAGAHSRNEEIDKLKELLTLRKQLYGAAIKELDKLRNPWISVEDGLPEKIKNKGVSKNVFVTWPDGTRGEAYYNYEEYKAPRWEIKGAGIMKPAYWMPIPQIEKGE